MLNGQCFTIKAVQAISGSHPHNSILILSDGENLIRVNAGGFIGAVPEVDDLIG
jgi:hypothetical protein